MFGRMKRKTLKAAFVTVSETGLVRKDNQDHVFVDDGKTVFCVADGMGGGSEGARASEIVCEEMSKAADGDFSGRLKAADGAIAAANDRIFRYAKEKGFKQMGSTVALLAVDPADAHRAAICHVGDSRVYRVRKGTAELLTADHTIGGQLSAFAKGRQADDLKSRTNPLSHVLTRAIGVEAKVEGEWRKLDVDEGDVFLVCSDGVHDVVSDGEVGSFLSASPDVKGVSERLAARVVACGAPDNYSFVIVRFGGVR